MDIRKIYNPPAYENVLKDPEKNLSVYDSPITVMTTKSEHHITEENDNMIMNAVWNAGVDIDKDKLVAALNQDQERYKEAYSKGYNAGLNDATVEANSEAYAKMTQYKYEANQHDDFFDWLACAVILDSDWEENPGFYREVICRKLVKLGKLEIEGKNYVLPEPEKGDSGE